MLFSGLAWHTNDDTFKEGFQPFGEVEEAVSIIHLLLVWEIKLNLLCRPW